MSADTSARLTADTLTEHHIDILLAQQLITTDVALIARREGGSRRAQRETRSVRGICADMLNATTDA